jgi:hypothetical protein
VGALMLRHLSEVPPPPPPRLSCGERLLPSAPAAAADGVMLGCAVDVWFFWISTEHNMWLVQHRGMICVLGLLSITAA